MNNIEDVKKMVNVLPFEEDVKKQIVDSADEIIKFNSHIAKKYVLTQIEAQTKVQQHLKSMFSLDSTDVDEIIKHSARNTKEYAISEGYESSENLELAIINLSNALKKFTK